MWLCSPWQEERKALGHWVRSNWSTFRWWHHAPTTMRNSLYVSMYGVKRLCVNLLQGYRLRVSLRISVQFTNLIQTFSVWKPTKYQANKQCVCSTMSTRRRASVPNETGKEVSNTFVRQWIIGNRRFFNTLVEIGLNIGWDSRISNNEMRESAVMKTFQQKSLENTSECTRPV